MNFTQSFIEEKYLEALGWTLLHSVWQIALISMLLWFALAMMNKKTSVWRYNTALSALALIFITGCWTFLYQLESAGNKPFLTYTADIKVDHASVISSNVVDYEAYAEEGSMVDYVLLKLEHYLPYLVNLWVLGAMFYIIRLAGSLYDLEKLHKKHHEAVPSLLLRKVNSLSASLGIFRKVEVFKSSLVHSPITYGMVKPIIILPASLLFSISPEQLEAIVAHELAHIKRNDYLVNLLQSFMEVLFFFHPCFWWINGQIKEERENATDDLAIAVGINPAVLAYGLAEVANFSNCPTPEMALAASGSRNLTLQRIKRILGKKTSPPKLSPLFPITMIVAIIISSVLLVGAQVQENKQENPLLTSLHIHNLQVDIPGYVKPRAAVKQTVKVQFTQDTLPIKKSTKAEKQDPMPRLELTPAPKLEVQTPAFPEAPPAPPAPVPGFEFPQLDIKTQTDSMTKIVLELQKLEDDKSPEAQKRKERLQVSMDKIQEDIEVLAGTFAEKIAGWQDKNGLLYEKFEEDLKVWEEKMQKHQKEWESSFEPKMKEFEQKMKEWEKENAPKLKEFEEKMKIWMEENEGNIEFQKSINTHSFNPIHKYFPNDNELSC